MILVIHAWTVDQLLGVRVVAVDKIIVFYHPPPVLRKWSFHRASFEILKATYTPDAGTVFKTLIVFITVHHLILFDCTTPRKSKVH